MTAQVEETDEDILQQLLSAHGSIQDSRDMTAFYSDQRTLLSKSLRDRGWRLQRIASALGITRHAVEQIIARKVS